MAHLTKMDLAALQGDFSHIAKKRRTDYKHVALFRLRKKMREITTCVTVIRRYKSDFLGSGPPTGVTPRGVGLLLSEDEIRTLGAVALRELARKKGVYHSRKEENVEALLSLINEG